MQAGTLAAIKTIVEALEKAPEEFRFNGVCGGSARVSAEANEPHVIIKGDRASDGLSQLYYLLWGMAVNLGLIEYDEKGSVEVGLRAMRGRKN